MSVRRGSCIQVDRDIIPEIRWPCAQGPWSFSAQGQPIASSIQLVITLGKGRMFVERSIFSRKDWELLPIETRFSDWTEFKTELKPIYLSIFLFGCSVFPHISLCRTPVTMCPRFTEVLFIIFSIILPSMLQLGWLILTVFKLTNPLFSYIQSTMNFIHWIVFSHFKILLFI